MNAHDIKNTVKKAQADTISIASYILTFIAWLFKKGIFFFDKISTNDWLNKAIIEHTTIILAVYYSRHKKSRGFGTWNQNDAIMKKKMAINIPTTDAASDNFLSSS